VLGDFHLSGNLTESGTVSGSVLSGDSDLLRALTHLVSLNICEEIQFGNIVLARKTWKSKGGAYHSDLKMPLDHVDVEAVHAIATTDPRGSALSCPD
jgi:hypothetical protein